LSRLLSFDTLPTRPNLRPAEIAAFLGVHITTVYEFLNSGELAHFRLSGPGARRQTIRINRQVFIDWYTERNKEHDAFA
jgi:excisionase family DNA binding protein